MNKMQKKSENWKMKWAKLKKKLEKLKKKKYYL